MGFFIANPASTLFYDVATGEVRWHAERRAAMSTLVSYLAAVGRPEGAAARLVWAGHEPTQFINLFPEWTAREDVKIFSAKVS